MLIAVILVFAFVFGCLATFNTPSHPRFTFGWAAVALAILALLVTNWPVR